MKVETLLDILTAAHLTDYVNSPFKSRGGIMLVAPPSSLKSTIIGQLSIFPNSIVVSDLNVQQLLKLRTDISNNIYSTVGIKEFEKLYQRHDATASNVEGHLKAMCEEGFAHGAADDHRMVVREARCLIVGAMTQSLYDRKYRDWLEDGFARRFIWCHYVMSDPKALMMAIHDWNPVDFIPDHVVFALPKRTIPYSLNEKESSMIGRLLAFQRTPETPFILLKKIACVLRWRYPESEKWWEILEDFGESLKKSGAELVVPARVKK